MSGRPYFNFKPEGNIVFPEYYEGFLSPRSGRTPFKIIDDPTIIAKKNQMRQALRDEHTRRIYNPYRWASGVGGHPFDPALQRYWSLLRQGWQYYRPGPKLNFTGLAIFVLFPCAMVFVTEEYVALEEQKKRTGLVAYKDRLNKWMY